MPSWENLLPHSFASGFLSLQISVRCCSPPPCQSADQELGTPETMAAMKTSQPDVESTFIQVQCRGSGTMVEYCVPTSYSTIIQREMLQFLVTGYFGDLDFTFNMK